MQNGSGKKMIRIGLEKGETLRYDKKQRTERKRGEEMSLKKRMFRSNMKILFAAMFSLMVIILLVLILLEDSLEKQVHSLVQSEMESHIVEVANLMERQDIRNAEDLGNEVGKWKYYTAEIADGAVISGDQGEQMKDMADSLALDDQSGQTHIYSYQKATVAAKYLESGDRYLVAVHFTEGNWLASSLNKSFYTFLGAVILAGIMAIVLLMLLASFFTRRMNRIIMEPVEQLVKGAERIQKGNLREEIDYQGEKEFEHVCQTFNDMQKTILEDQEQRTRTEKARTDMVTGISHDLRTPLTSIQGYIKGIMDGIADTEEKKTAYLKTAYESTEEMNLLLQKLFDFSRMESGQMPFHMVKADLAEYAAAYVAQKEKVTDPAVLEFHMNAGESMPEIFMDVEQVRRILDNLLENSQKYAMTVPVRVDLSIKETEQYIILEWKDNGQGVPEEKLERIFERFYRCDESRTKKGSGVGLYVVKYIMERHKGMVKASNESGLKISLYFSKPGRKEEEA